MTRSTYVIYHNDRGQHRDQAGHTTLWPHGREVLTEVKRYRRPHYVEQWRNDHPDADVWVYQYTPGYGSNSRWIHREHSEYSATETMGADPAVVRLFKQPYDRVYPDITVRARFEILYSTDEGVI